MLLYLNLVIIKIGLVIETLFRINMKLLQYLLLKLPIGGLTNGKFI